MVEMHPDCKQPFLDWFHSNCRLQLDTIDPPITIPDLRNRFLTDFPQFKSASFKITRDSCYSILLPLVGIRASLGHGFYDSNGASRLFGWTFLTIHL